jgi:CBS domain-containing protein
MYLKDICILDVANCTSEHSVSAAAQIMRQQHTGDLIVIDDCDGGFKPIGIVTDRDIVMEVLALERDPRKTQVGEIMSKRLVVACGDEDVATALERMRTHGVRRLPVVGDGERLLGIVTLDDALHWVAQQVNSLCEIVDKGRNREQRSKRG